MAKDYARPDWRSVPYPVGFLVPPDSTFEVDSHQTITISTPPFPPIFDTPIVGRSGTVGYASLLFSYPKFSYTVDTGSLAKQTAEELKTKYRRCQVCKKRKKKASVNFHIRNLIWSVCITLLRDANTVTKTTLCVSTVTGAGMLYSSYVIKPFILSQFPHRLPSSETSQGCQRKNCGISMICIKVLVRLPIKKTLASTLTYGERITKWTFLTRL